MSKHPEGTIGGVMIWKVTDEAKYRAMATEFCKELDTHKGFLGCEWFLEKNDAGDMYGYLVKEWLNEEDQRVHHEEYLPKMMEAMSGSMDFMGKEAKFNLIGSPTPGVKARYDSAGMPQVYFDKVAGFKKFFEDKGTHIHTRTVYNVKDLDAAKSLAADWVKTEDETNEGMLAFEFGITSDGKRACIFETITGDEAHKKHNDITMNMYGERFMAALDMDTSESVQYGVVPEATKERFAFAKARNAKERVAGRVKPALE